MSQEGMSREHLEAFVGFLAAHAHLVRQINRQLQDAGLITMEVYDILIALECAPEQRVRMTELAELSLLSPSGITRLIDRLERLGYVRRESNAKDRRSTFAVLTPLGQETREQAWPIHRQILVDTWETKLTEDEAMVLTGLMRKFVVKLPCVLPDSQAPSALIRS